jgi:hypothetical protein
MFARALRLDDFGVIPPRDACERVMFALRCTFFSLGRGHGGNAISFPFFNGVDALGEQRPVALHIGPNLLQRRAACCQCCALDCAQAHFPAAAVWAGETHDPGSALRRNAEEQPATVSVVAVARNLDSTCTEKIDRH